MISILEDTIFSTVFIGTGGSGMGLTWINAEGGLKGLSLEASVYTGDVDIEKNRIAVGTKNGCVYILSMSEGDKGGLSVDINNRFFVSAGVTSVCFAGGDTVVISDTSARTLLWKTSEPGGTCRTLPATAGVIGSLCRIDDDTIAGLSLDGKILLWNAASAELIRFIDCPEPDAAVVLPKLKYWKAQNALVWPALDGNLASCRLDDFKTSEWPAHRYRFSAIIIDGDDLVTIGAYDRKVLRWHDFEKSTICSDCPEGIIDAIDYPMSLSKRYWLIDGLGQAAVYSFDNGTATNLFQLPGSRARCLIVPGQYTGAQFLESKNNRTVEKILREADVMLSDNPSACVNNYCNQLKTLGFDTLALGLKAKAASVNHDIIAELAAYHQLAAVLPIDDRRSSGYLSRYIETLLALWQTDIVRHLLYSIGFNIYTEKKHRRLTEIVSSQKQKQRLGICKYDLPVLIEACNITGTQFAGRWLLPSPKSIVLKEQGITVDQLAEKYNQLRDHHNLANLPKAAVCPFLNAYDEGVVQQTQMMVLDGSDSKRPAVYYAVSIANNGCFDTIIPASIFEADSDDTEQDFKRHNDRILKFYEKIIENKTHLNWPGQIGRLITTAAGLISNQLHRKRENL